MTTICDTSRDDLVEAQVDLVATQYRESGNLLAMMRAYLGQVADIVGHLCPLPDEFDLDTATGDQLTIIGKWMGFPREHCEGARQAVFGFSVPVCPPPWFGFSCDYVDDDGIFAGTGYGPLADESGGLLVDEDGALIGVEESSIPGDGSEQTIGGFCDSFGPFPGGECDPCSDAAVGGFCSDWAGCNSSERIPYVFADDEVYRRVLKAWRHRIRRDYRRSALLDAARSLFGPFATVFCETPGTVEISIGRPITGDEWQTLDIMRQVLPTAPGVRVLFRKQSTIALTFGFGDGWGGFCGPWAGYVDGEAIETSPCFLGFGADQAGFCT